jgi:hypothetical protein
VTTDKSGLTSPDFSVVTGLAGRSENDATLAQTLGQFQPFVAVFPQERMG